MVLNRNFSLRFGNVNRFESIQPAESIRIDFPITSMNCINHDLHCIYNPNSMYCFHLWYGVFVPSCGTVDGAYGPVRNSWQYQFCRLPQQADERMLHAASGSKSSSNTERVIKHARDYHVSSSSSSSANSVDTVCSTEQSASQTGVNESDWYITGGSSGGSAVAVATGVAFA